MKGLSLSLIACKLLANFKFKDFFEQNKNILLSKTCVGNLTTELK
jgi:hypothetical protein